MNYALYRRGLMISRMLATARFVTKVAEDQREGGPPKVRGLRAFQESNGKVAPDSWMCTGGFSRVKKKFTRSRLRGCSNTCKCLWRPQRTST